MRNTLIPASFLAVAHATERNVLQTEHEIFIIREEDASVTSRLYHLFFQGEKKRTQQALTNEAVAEPDYFSSYE